MKILILTTLIGLAYIFKNYFYSESPSTNEDSNYMIDITNFYTVHYKTYDHINYDIKITEKEKKIIDAFINGVRTNYTVRIVGGWVRDKVKICL